MQQVFALIDCNNFFVSCERLFRPDLEGKPVAVLSSNDGCIVARSDEVKALGIPMGAPVFKWRYLFNQHKVTTFSANFELYGDVSKRIVGLLTTVTPRIEIYSVDESFLDLSTLDIKDYGEWGRRVRASVLKNIGVPVSIGIAPTKTLAKFASEIAKREATYRGSVDWIGASKDWKYKALASLHVNDVWGVGRRLAPKLKAEGISNGLHLSELRPKHAQQLMGIHGRQMVAELNGISCHPLEREHKSAQSIMRGRTFGEDTNELHVLESAIASMTTRAAFALRRDNLLARRIGFFTETNRHKPGYRHWVEDIRLDQPTSDTGHIIALLVERLGNIYSRAQHYHRLGVYLYDLIPETALQTDMLGHVSTDHHDRASQRMQAIDRINTKHGKGKIHFAAEDLAKSWEPKHHIRSPGYVSNWNELPEARLS